MNAINQIIIEGTVKSVKTNEKSKVCIIEVEHNRFFENDESVEVTTFKCYAYGKMGEILMKKAKVEKNIRIIGRLKTERYLSYGENELKSKLIVVIEHYEINDKN